MSATADTTASDRPAPAADAGIGFIQIERLEYGKFTVRPDGPIEFGTEHRQLGHSSGFPNDLARLCVPSTIGTTTRLDRSVPEWEHASILRPVVLGGSLHTVFVQMRRRAEDGDQQGGRMYTAARYLTSPSSLATPLGFLEAMSSVPFLGITREQAEALPPIRAVVEQVPQLDRAGMAFLRQAVVYVMSGFPITVTGEIEERKFFEWITGLWFLLPPSYRQLLSAGWRVGPSLAGTLTVTHTTAGIESTANYAYGNATWTAPRAVVLANGANQEPLPFTEQRLNAGRMYAFYAFEWMSEGPAIDALSPRRDIGLLATGMSPSSFGTLPEMRDRGIVRAFRVPGLRAYDDYRIRELSEWLKTGAGRASATDYAAPFTYPENDVKALELAIVALHGGPQRSRADAYVSALFRTAPPAHVTKVVASRTSAGSARVRLIAQTAAGASPHELTEAFVQASAAEEVEELPNEVLEGVTGALNARLGSLDLAAAEHHVRVLALDRIPPAYREWVREHPTELLYAIARWRIPDHRRALQSIDRIVSQRHVAAIVAYLLGNAPTPEQLQAIRENEAEQQEHFARQLGADWSRGLADVAARRETILQWMSSCRPNPDTHPLLRLQRGEMQLSRADLEQIAREADAGAIPPSLTVAVGALALRDWSVFRPFVDPRRATWSVITATWPALYRTVLLDERNAITTSVHPAVAAAAEETRLSLDEVQAILELWVDRFPLTSHSTREVATLLWRFARQAVDAGSPYVRAAELCRAVDAGSLPSGSPSEDDIRRAARLFSEARVEVPRESVQALWTGAGEFWQIQLVLELFPSTELTPAVQQLERLAENRTWLQQFLARNPYHRRALHVAMLTFHQVPYATVSNWSPEYARSFLWAAFSGLPVQEQGGLRRALEHYASQAQERFQAVSRYLRHSNPDERDEVVYRVLRDYVIPDLFERSSRRHVETTFALIRERAAAPPHGWRSAAGSIRSFWCRIRRARRLSVVANDTASSSRLVVRGRNLILPEATHAFLHDLAPSRDVLSRAITDAQGAPQP